MKQQGACTHLADPIKPSNAKVADGAHPQWAVSRQGPERRLNIPGAKKYPGFTLIELMIVVVIIGVIAAIAYPAYVDQVRKSRRSEAKSALADAAARMEKYYMDNKTYNTTDMTQLGYNTSPYSTTNGYYQVSVVAASTTATSYQLQAVAQSKDGQNKDTGCTTMKLDSQGVKLPAGCW